MQLVGLGELHTLAEVRVIAQNTPVQVYTPRNGQRAVRNEAAQHFSTFISARVH